MKYRRNHRFPNKRSFWDAVNTFGEDMVYHRNDPPIKPGYRVYFIQKGYKIAILFAEETNQLNPVTSNRRRNSRSIWRS